MNNIKSNFSIKDLENLSGVKAHTIRIWEKRYNLLSPNRTDTNIRTYNIESLQKLLNVCYLNNNGHKISKIAELSKKEISNAVTRTASHSGKSCNATSAFKLAMLNFDQRLFCETYDTLSQSKPFEDIFYNNIIPLLNDIGLLWQTDTITPANEHFITALIKQKLTLKIENEQSKLEFKHDKIFVLFLPLNEIHELGLMFLHYQLLKTGIQSIYLGQSVPMDSLQNMLNFHDNITFVSFFTVMPKTGKVADYISAFNDKILVKGDHRLLLLGRKLATTNLKNLPTKVTSYSSIENLCKNVIKTYKLTSVEP